MVKKAALVTGAKRGIGLAIARALRDAGYAVGLCATSEDETSEAVVHEFEKAGADFFYRVCDIADAKQADALFDEMERRFGRLDVVVNNAGIAPKVRGDLLELSSQSFDRVMEVNLKGTFFMCQRAAKRMIGMLGRNLTDYRPRMINIASVSAYASSTSRGEYCISKAGIAMTTKLFADRLGEYGIPVFEVRPGIIRTDMTAGVLESYLRRISDGLTPIRRIGEPEDVAACVLSLAGGAFDFCTGQVIDCDGGFHIQRL